MVSLPEYLTTETRDAILSRMLALIPDGIDKTEGGFIWDALAPAAVELALKALNAQDVLRYGFVSTASGEYLDLRADEHGLTRLPATKATGEVTFSGIDGTEIPAGTTVSTAASTGSPAREFVTDEEATIVDGSVRVAVTASEAGLAWNVASDTIVLLKDNVPGVTGVTNIEDTTGGTDIESDEALRQRYYLKVRNPSAGGNSGDYLNWALSVPGVGAASVVPLASGPGTVTVAILNTDKEAPSQDLIDAVLEYIVDPIRYTSEAEGMDIGLHGVSIDNTLDDDSGTSVKMEYDAGGDGTLRDFVIDTHLIDGGSEKAPGIWIATARVKVDSIAGTDDLLRFGIENVDTAGWADLGPNDPTDAFQVLVGQDLDTDWVLIQQRFYWNGSDVLQTRIDRIQDDTLTTLWVDWVEYRSTFSDVRGDGLAPVGALVTVEGGTPVEIDVNLSITVQAGFTVATVREACEEAVIAYFESLAFQSANDVRFVRVGSAILDVPGVVSVNTLQLNGVAGDVAIGPTEYAVVGTFTHV